MVKLKNQLLVPSLKLSLEDMTISMRNFHIVLIFWKTTILFMPNHKLGKYSGTFWFCHGN